MFVLTTHFFFRIIEHRKKVSVINRIRELRKTLGLSQEEFGRRLGVTRGAITNIELGKVEIKPLFLDLICREFNASENWLQTGEGEMFRKVSDEIGYSVEELLEYSGEGNPFYDAVLEMIKKYHSMDEKSRRVVEDFIQGIVDGVRKKGEG